MTNNDLERAAEVVETALSARGVPLLTSRGEFATFVGPLNTEADLDREVLAVVVAVWACVGASYWRFRKDLFKIVIKIHQLLTTEVSANTDRWERAAELAIWYLLGGSGRWIDRKSKTLDNIPVQVRDIVTGHLNKLAKEWLHRLLKVVIGFREELIATREQGQTEEEALNDESINWSIEIYQILMGASNACRCWMPKDMIKQHPNAYLGAYPKGNIGRKYAACRQWHHISFWIPDGSLTLWEFFSKALTGGPDPGRVGKKSLPSGMLWHCWNKDDTRPSLLLRLAKVARRKCPECKKWGAGRRCSDENCRRDLSKPEIEIRAEDDYLILDRCFEAEKVWVCTNIRCRAIYLKKAMSPVPKCGICKMESISSKPSEVYFLRRFRLAGGTNLGSAPDSAVTQEIDIDDYNKLLQEVERRYPRSGWKCRVIRLRCGRPEKVREWREVWQKVYQHSPKYPDLPRTVDELKDWFESEARSVVTEILSTARVKL